MRSRVGVIAVFGVVLVSGCAHARSSDQDRAPVSLEQRHSAFLAAVAARDADRLAELFAESAVVHVSNMPPIEGRAAIHQFYGNLFRFLTGSRATSETTHVSESRDLAYIIGNVSNEFRGPEGLVEYAGKYVLLWRRMEGDWMAVLYSVSSNQPTDTRADFAGWGLPGMIGFGRQPSGIPVAAAMPGMSK